MANQFENLRRTWEELGEKDPLWAVVSVDKKRGGKWDVDEFLKTGETDVSRYHHLLQQKAGCPPTFQHVLDFGCGVGRLCLAWSRRAARVTGVDISEPMLEKARILLGDVQNVEFQLNLEQGLKRFRDAEFDLVASHICLQHMPWDIASKYLQEFGRVCRPNGWVAFQLPYKGGKLGPTLRKKIIESLPFGFDRIYRRYRHGVEVVFEMYYTPHEKVIAVANAAGLDLMHKEPDFACGQGSEGFLYIFRKAP